MSSNAANAPRITRRRFGAVAFWSGVGLTGMAAAVALARFLYPNKPAPELFGLNFADIPEPGGAPFIDKTSGLIVVNLLADEGVHADLYPPPGREPAKVAAPGGLLVMSTKCPHLGCAVEWDPDFRRPDIGVAGAIICHCHGSVFTKAGVRFFGPSPRSLDTYTPVVGGDRKFALQKGEVQPGGLDNPSRAIPWSDPS